MLTCQQLTEIVSDYVERRMSLWERLRIQMHLGMCGSCRAYLRQVKITVRTVGEMPKEPIPEDIRAELMDRFRGLRPESGSRKH